MAKSLSPIPTMRRVLSAALAARRCVPSRTSSQLDAVERARREWHAADDYYHRTTDPEEVEYAVFELKARERRYMYLLQKARNCNLVVDDQTLGAWLIDR